MTSTNPYADAYADYWAAGWRGVLPLPYKAKKHPPTGYTGRNYTEPSYADCAAWAESGQRNIALHLPRGVIGIDVDDYAGKGGGATLARLVAEHGPLPATWLSTSRGDGISGIRLFRIPDDMELISALPGIEIIQAHHRYVVCWPSIHPETTSIYEWVDESSGESGIPVLDDLPHLPGAWIDALTSTGTAKDKADVDADDITRFLAGLPDGEPCQHIIAAAGYAMSGKDRHDAYNGAMLGVLDRGRAGCPGAILALNRLKASFIAEITAPGTSGRRTEAEANAEWGRGMVGAIAIAIAEHPEQGHGCPDDYLAELILTEQRQEQTADQAADDKRDAYKLAVARKAGELQLLDDAREILAIRKAGQAPALSGNSLSAFLAQPDEPVAYRIEQLWPINGRVLLAAAAKAGKTTLVMNLLKALADGGTFLGCYDVEQVTNGTIVYLNMEVSVNQMRRWMRRAGIVNDDRIVVANLRGQISALTLGSESGRQRVAEWLRGFNAEVVILDPLAPLLGSLGLEEKENSDIARFFSWWSEMLYDAGVSEDFICHHAGWDGTRSRGASRLVDEPDAVWTINKDKAIDEDGDDVYDNNEPRFLKAIGRDVDLPEALLRFDATTGDLELVDGNRKQMRAEALRRQAEVRVLAKIDAGATSTRDIVKNNGNEKQNAAALESLVAEGVLTCQALGVGRPTIYRRTVGVASVAKVSPETVATGGVASLYIGDTPDGTPASPPECEDCGGDTGKPSLKLCRDCADRRAKGAGL